MNSIEEACAKLGNDKAKMARVLPEQNDPLPSLALPMFDDRRTQEVTRMLQTSKPVAVRIGDKQDSGSVPVVVYIAPILT